MAETRVNGHDGNADWGSNEHNAVLRTWSATLSQTLTDVTGFQDTWANSLGGVQSGRFSCGGTPSFDAATTAPNADSPARGGNTITLTVATGCTYGGTAVLGNVALNCDKNGATTVTFDGNFTGAVTETWDETA